MGTRSGDIDAGILEYLMNKYGMDIKEMVNAVSYTHLRRSSGSGAQPSLRRIT